MALGQEPTTGRQGRSEFDIYLRPTLWVLGAALALVFIGIFIAAVSQPPLGMWETVGFLVMTLGLFVLVGIPGALVALRHPWGAGFRLIMDGRYAHPRLVGLTAVWAGLVLPGGLAVMTLLRFPFSPEQDVLFTLPVGLVGLAPILALFLFDRRPRNQS